MLAPASLQAQGASPNAEPVLRGELVRFADATVLISVFADRPADIPEALWERFRGAGAAAFLPASSPTLNDEVRRRLEEVVGAGAIRTVAEAAELDPLGVHVSATEGVRLVWHNLSEDEGVAVLADARAADDFFTLRIVIPNLNVTEEDWWGLQAALSKVGIRRVQILGGGAP